MPIAVASIERKRGSLVFRILVEMDIAQFNWLAGGALEMMRRFSPARLSISRGVCGPKPWQTASPTPAAVLLSAAKTGIQTAATVRVKHHLPGSNST
jgi:hypothetical protein